MSVKDHNTFDSLAVKIERLEEENEIMREVLEWYASEWNQVNPQKARKVLGKVN